MDKFAERLALRPTEAAEVLGISVSRLYTLVAAGVLPAIKIGGSTRVPTEELRRWVQARADERALERVGVQPQLEATPEAQQDTTQPA